MTTTLNLADGREVTITWTRIRDTQQIYGHRYMEVHVNLFKVQEALKCQVDGIPNTFVGWAFMSRNEPFYDAARARKLSLERALEFASKPDRTLVWQAYNKEFPPAPRAAISPVGRALRAWLNRITEGQAL